MPGKAAVGVELGLAGDMAVGVGPLLADTDGVEALGSFVGERSREYDHRRLLQADLAARRSAAADRMALMIGS